MAMFQNRREMITFLGCCCCRYSAGAPPEPHCNVRGKMGAGEMEDNRGIVMEGECVVGVQNLGGRLLLMLLRAGVLVGVVVLVVVGVMVVVAVGVIFFGKRCFSVMEVGGSGVGFALVVGSIPTWMWMKS